ncbi:MAG TPA: SRPBCC family protein [Steroidobacteraceae bacterium]|nr:SRPBCC family protein [Steroidobacteraceae bacterium]
MTEFLKRTSYDDAPLSSAKHPDATRAEGSATPRRDDEVVSRTVTINRPREELYRFWRELSNLPRFMQNIERIDRIDSRRSHWVVLAPGHKTVEWDSTITADVPGELIAWCSTGDASVRNSGRVEFRDSPVGRGTEVTATIVYDPPLGALGKLVAKLFAREPKIQTRQDLRRFKQLMETGEVATAQPPEAAPRAA